MSEVKIKRKPDQEEINDLDKLRLECLGLLEENNFPVNIENPKEIATSLRQFIDHYKAKNLTDRTKAYSSLFS